MAYRSDCIRVSADPICAKEAASNVYGFERKPAVVIYTLAAEFERRSDCIDANWVVVAEPFNNQMMIEICDGEECEHALQVVQQTFGDLDIDHLVPLEAYKFITQREGCKRVVPTHEHGRSRYNG